MKMKINGKKLKNKIESVLLKGKWNNGASNKSNIISPSVIISLGTNGRICTLYNGNSSTFVSANLLTEDLEDSKTGRLTIDSDILLKYLPDNNCIFQLKDNILQLVDERKTVKIPILNRHENNDSILHCEKNYEVSRDINKNVKVSEKTILKTRIKVSTLDLINAFKDCEAVGNCVFKLDFDGDNLIISSNKDNESVTVSIEPLTTIGAKATMEFSAPFYKYLEGRVTILSFNDESPLSIISGDNESEIKVLRAPRIEA